MEIATPVVVARGRRRSEGKRVAMLAAAEALFVADGYEHVSVDAIAARAQVSKRTIYDHFGDKKTLFVQVLERVNGALVAALRAAVHEELTDERDLREALFAFAMRVVTQTFPSSDYATFRRLEAQGPSAPRLTGADREHPERLLEERFADLVAAGRIRAADPRVAARHFTALTIRLALEALRESAGGRLDASELRTIVDDGVDVFLRAYT